MLVYYVSEGSRRNRSEALKNDLAYLVEKRNESLKSGIFIAQVFF